MWKNARKGRFLEKEQLALVAALWGFWPLVDDIWATRTWGRVSYNASQERNAWRKRRDTESLNSRIQADWSRSWLYRRKGQDEYNSQWAWWAQPWKAGVNRRMGASEDFRVEGNTVSAMVYKEVWASKSRTDQTWEGSSFRNWRCTRWEWRSGTELPPQHCGVNGSECWRLTSSDSTVCLARL